MPFRLEVAIAPGDQQGRGPGGIALPPEGRDRIEYGLFDRIKLDEAWRPEGSAPARLDVEEISRRVDHAEFGCHDIGKAAIALIAKRGTETEAAYQRQGLSGPNEREAGLAKGIDAVLSSHGPSESRAAPEKASV